MISLVVFNEEIIEVNIHPLLDKPQQICNYK